MQLTKQFWPKEVWIGWFSSTAEAYNMAIYSFTAPFLAGKLFSSENSTTALFFSYALVLLAAGVFYPLGALYFGTLGDREGRQKICVASTLGLALATGLLGLLPFGELTWICFLALICAQYFFSGGEYHSSIVFSLEHGEGNKAGVLSALSCLFAVFGLAGANGLANLAFSNSTLIGIRFCFLLGAVGGVLSYLLKNHCSETPPFTLLKKQSFVRGWAFLKEEWAKILYGVSLLAFFLVSYNFIFIFLPLLPLGQGAAFDTFKSLFAYGFLLVVSGWLADKFGLRKVILAGMASFALIAIPLTLVSTNLLLLQITLTLCACLTIGPLHSGMLNLFAVQNRCRGIFWSSAIATALFCGSTTPICLALFERFHSVPLCALYPTVIAFSALICAVWYHRRSYDNAYLETSEHLAWQSGGADQERQPTSRM